MRDDMKNMITTIEKHYSYYQQQAMADKVLHAISSVPRHEFGADYEDHAMSIGYKQTISQPFMVAIMTDIIYKNSIDHDAILEIGAGCGYQCAILSKLYKQVYGIERIQSLAKLANQNLAKNYNNVDIMHGNGYFGWTNNKQFSAIIVACGVKKDIPKNWHQQLKEGGILLAPYSANTEDSLQLIAWQKKNNELVEIKVLDKALYCNFVPFINNVSKD